MKLGSTIGPFRFGTAANCSLQCPVRRCRQRPDSRGSGGGSYLEPRYTYPCQGSPRARPGRPSSTTGCPWHCVSPPLVETIWPRAASWNTASTCWPSVFPAPARPTRRLDGARPRHGHRSHPGRHPGRSHHPHGGLARRDRPHPAGTDRKRRVEALRHGRRRPADGQRATTPRGNHAVDSRRTSAMPEIETEAFILKTANDTLFSDKNGKDLN